MIIKGPTGEKFVVFQIGQTIDEINCEILELTLEHHSGNRTYAARALGISLRTVRNWIRRWGLNDKAPENC